MKLPKYVQAWVDREGRAHHYFRRRGYPRVPLPALPWSPSFMASYEVALSAEPSEIATNRAQPGSAAAVIAGYLGSDEFAGLKPSTQKIRRVLLEKLRREHGEKPIALLPREFVERMLKPMRPGAQLNWLKTLRGLLQYCVAKKLCKADVTAGIKLHLSKTGGHHTWTDDEVLQFETFHPIGSRARLAFGLGLFTAQRRGDVIRMGRQHLRNGVLHVEQEKTGARLAIPIHPELQTILDATPSDRLTFLMTRFDKPFSGQSFTMWFGEACDQAGLGSRCTFHGLRKAACRRLAEAGCTVHEIAAISGHKTLKEIQRYTEAADQARLARNAMERARAKEASNEKSSKPVT